MILSLALASLLGYRARALLAALGVAVSAAMLLDMVMLSSGMGESFRRLLADGGFHLRVTPKGTVPFDSDASIGDASDVAARLRAIPGVTLVSPVLGASLHVPHGEGAVAAFALGVEPAVQRDYMMVAGTDILVPHAMAANDAFLQAAGAHLGDTLEVAVGYDPQLRGYAGQRKVVVTARVRFRYLSDEQRAVALPLATLQAMGATESRDRVSLLMVRVGEGVDPERVSAEIVRTIPRVSAISTAGAIALAEQRLSYFRQLSFILGAVSLVVGFLLVTTLMTVSVNERVGEIAVMRAIGISRLHVVQQITVEGMALTLVGAIAGLALGLATARYLDSILSQFPGLPEAIDFFLFQPMAVAKAFGMLCLSGIAAALYPSWRAASLPIAGTLRREIGE